MEREEENKEKPDRVSFQMLIGLCSMEKGVNFSGGSDYSVDSLMIQFYFPSLSNLRGYTYL